MPVVIWNQNMNDFKLIFLVLVLIFNINIILAKDGRYFTEKLDRLCTEMKESKVEDYNVLSKKIDNLQKALVTLSSKLEQINAGVNKLTESHQCKLENVAFKKPVTMSSWLAKTRSWGGYMCCAPEYATDGNVTTFAHTDHSSFPYMYVDLESVYDISRIEVINRSDRDGIVPAKLRNLKIEVGKTLDTLKHCSDYQGPGKKAERISFVCSQQLSGRYVKFTLNNGSNPLQLSEIMVYAPLTE